MVWLLPRGKPWKLENPVGGASSSKGISGSNNVQRCCAMPRHPTGRELDQICFRLATFLSKSRRRTPTRQHCQHKSPATHKRAPRPIDFAQIDILSSRGWHHRLQFCVSKRANERKQTGHNPHAEDHVDDGRWRAMRLGGRKIPDPITIPMTIAIVSSISRVRGRSVRLAAAPPY
jgi:hypothetical protein